MNPFFSSIFALVSYLRSHPIAATATGATSGVATWLISWGEHLALAFRVLGGFFGAMLTIMCFVFALPRLVRFIVRWRKHGFMKADGDEPPFLPRK